MKASEIQAGDFVELAQGVITGCAGDPDNLWFQLPADIGVGYDAQEQPLWGSVADDPRREGEDVVLQIADDFTTWQVRVRADREVLRVER